MSKDYKLSLNDDTFNGLKSDFDQMLRKTLSNMEQRDNEQAEMTVKVKITLSKDTAPDLDVSAYAATREIIRPKFDHKVSAVMQHKDETSGTVGGNYELVWDASIGDYVMREITNGQTSLFDNNEAKVVNAEYREVDDNGTKVLESHKVLALPTPEESDEVPQLTPFEYLRRFVGEHLRCVEFNGSFSVRTDDNLIALTTGESIIPLFNVPAELLKPHVGHHIVCVTYGDDEPVNISIECEDCNTVIFGIDISEEMTEGSTRQDEPGEDQPEDYPYDEPGGDGDGDE